MVPGRKLFLGSVVTGSKSDREEGERAQCQHRGLAEPQERPQSSQELTLRPPSQETPACLVLAPKPACLLLFRTMNMVFVSGDHVLKILVCFPENYRDRRTA